MPRVRVHQHVNPLAPFYRQTPVPLVIEDLFSDPARPLFMDIGCARGRFLLKMASELPEYNYLGVEIREPLVEEANRLAAEAGLANLRYSFCNAMLWLDRLIENFPDGRLQMVTIQFPDPWFKKKHEKRRMVNREMADAIARKLAPAGKVFVQTDIEFLAEEMFEIFRSHEALAEEKIDANPFPVKTERELAVEGKSLPVYRSIFNRIG
ncbi:MAG: tRNA (guanosine(46)-N7)-methyltransferase TrmB [Acidobacteria bacterium ACB1]|nr:tRNA (guanine-N(7)-)-methyltransferase [Pyrinomonadaceae bacterium]MCE7961786.1 tRNA (guanosine(46)-N7)-methyltransferase TrmB [Acidobacteria bacterium ACB1]RIJ94891.1 MAG: tRNA (guanosine(46)-N7)-methyltransferase TrmB [Acidobacteriota bacterium]